MVDVVRRTAVRRYILFPLFSVFFHHRPDTVIVFTIFYALRFTICGGRSTIRRTAVRRYDYLIFTTIKT